MSVRLLIAAFVVAVAWTSAQAQQWVVPAWSHYPGFFSPASHGSAIIDLDGNGTNEAVVTGASGYSAEDIQFFAILAQRHGALQVIDEIKLQPGETFVGEFVALPAFAGRSAQILAIVSTSGERELVTFSGKRLARTAAVPVSDDFLINQVVDLEGDGQLEVLGTDLEQPRVLDLATGAVRWADTIHRATALRAGQLDTDPVLEIVIAYLSFDFSPGYVIDGATFTEQWAYAPGFRGKPVIGNFDANPSTTEFAIVELGGYTRVFVTTPIFSPLSEFYTGEVSPPAVLDINLDGVDDIVVGDSQWGNLNAYNPLTWQTLFSHPNPEHGVTTLAVGQLDNDAAWEVIFGAGVTSSGTDLLRVFEVGSNRVEFDQEDDAGPHSSTLLADLSQDGNPEVVFATYFSESGYAGHRLAILDAHTGRVLRGISDLLDPWGPNYGAQLLAVNLDGDPQLEIVAGGGQVYSAHLKVIDSLSLQTQWQRFGGSEGDTIAALALIQANQDGVPDIIAAHSGRIHLHDGGSGDLMWSSVTVGHTGTGTTLSVANIDGDPAEEILLATSSSLFALDSVTQHLERSIPRDTPVIGQLVEGTGDDCRWVLIEESRLVRLRCDTGLVDSVRDYAIPHADFVRFAEDSHGVLLLSDGDRAFLQEGDAIRVQTESVGPLMGWNNRGAFAYANREATVYLGGATAVQKLELSLDRLFRTGFE